MRGGSGGIRDRQFLVPFFAPRTVQRVTSAGMIEPGFHKSVVELLFQTIVDLNKTGQKTDYYIAADAMYISRCIKLEKDKLTGFVDYGDLTLPAYDDDDAAEKNKEMTSEQEELATIMRALNPKVPNWSSCFCPL